MPPSTLLLSALGAAFGDGFVAEGSPSPSPGAGGAVEFVVVLHHLPVLGLGLLQGVITSTGTLGVGFSVGKPVDTREMLWITSSFSVASRFTKLVSTKSVEASERFKNKTQNNFASYTRLKNVRTPAWWSKNDDDDTIVCLL